MIPGTPPGCSIGLGRIQVRETSGLRRFLYPFSCELPSLPGYVNPELVSLTRADRTVVPCQLTRQIGAPARLDFVLSLNPHEEVWLRLLSEGPRVPVDDPIRARRAPDPLWMRAEQSQFAVDIDPLNNLRQVTYGGQEFLRVPAAVRRGRTRMWEGSGQECLGDALLAAWRWIPGRYADGVQALTRNEFTACKSWVHQFHTLLMPKPHDVITIGLPLALQCEKIACTFGAGGGATGALTRDYNDTLVWRWDYGPDDAVAWKLSHRGIVNDTGQTQRAAHQGTQWLHIEDTTRSLAAAVTTVPDFCRRVCVTVAGDGNVGVEFTLGAYVPWPARFGVCWHFLNDAPALAAATHPRSILLPPSLVLEPE